MSFEVLFEVDHTHPLQSGVISFMCWRALSVYSVSWLA